MTSHRNHRWKKLRAAHLSSTRPSSSDRMGRHSLNDLWLRADDQLKIFDAVPKDDQAHTRRLSIEPSDDLHLRTRVGPRRVRQVEISLSLRWKHERIPLHAANVVTYQPVNPADPQCVLKSEQSSNRRRPHPRTCVLACSSSQAKTMCVSPFSSRQASASDG